VIDSSKSSGKKLEWIEANVNEVIDQTIPKTYESLSQNQSKATA
jgi:hypothetical protein